MTNCILFQLVTLARHSFVGIVGGDGGVVVDVVVGVGVVLGVGV